MAVGLQASRTILVVTHPYPALGKWQDHYMYQVSRTLPEAWIQIFNRLR